MSLRLDGLVLDHVGKAALADSMALMASFLEADELSQITLPVAGLTTSKVCSVSTSVPLTWIGTVCLEEPLTPLEAISVSLFDILEGLVAQNHGHLSKYSV